MNAMAFRKMERRLAALTDYLKWRFDKNSAESVYFYTFHKCASTLFSGYVLKNIEGLRHVDYAGQIYMGRRIKRVKFQDKGYVYGPLRLSANPLSPVYKMLIEPASDIKFVQGKIAIFLVRDPRDIVVSAYYSFGYNHGLSPAEQIRETQAIRRREIQTKTVDEYVVDSANRVLKNFETVNELTSVCEQSIVLRYEDMIIDFENFIHGFTRYVNISPGVIQQIYERSRPREIEDTLSQRRSGQPGGFRSKLRQETITSLNRRFAHVLGRFQYEA